LTFYSVDVQKIPIEDLLKLGDNRILLPITVDQQGENIIEIIQQGQANIVDADPDRNCNISHYLFYETGNFSAFPVDGDSMPPHKKVRSERLVMLWTENVYRDY
jgi:hypothetical protein